MASLALATYCTDIAEFEFCIKINLLNAVLTYTIYIIQINIQVGYALVLLPPAACEGTKATCSRCADITFYCKAVEFVRMKFPISAIH